MKEIVGNLWDQVDVDAIVITTNGYVKKNGEAVMGRGCAREAAQKWKLLPALLGAAIERSGNHAHVFDVGLDYYVISMPVKHSWRDTADIGLIVQSARELVAIADAFWLRSIVLPRPGCGNGHLNWEDVRPMISGILNDRFSVITFA